MHLHAPATARACRSCVPEPRKLRLRHAPITPIILGIVVILCLEYGSRFFNRIPSLEVNLVLYQARIESSLALNPRSRRIVSSTPRNRSISVRL